MPYQDDMSQVADWGEVLPEGWYHFRLIKQEEKPSENTPGEKVIWLTHACQEEPFVGRQLLDFCSLQKHALAKLKAYYKKAGYEPGPEGHDPQRIADLNAEYFLLVQHDVYKGATRMKVPPWGIRSLAEGKPA